MGTVSPLRRFADGLANVLTGRGTTADRQVHNFWTRMAYTQDQIEAAYRGNWLHRKTVDVPAQDMTRAGRDWDAPDEDIAKIEAEERRLGVWAKLRAALILGRLGGGAILIGLGDDPARPLPANISAKQVQYLTVLSRWQVTLGDMVMDPISPLFGQPEYFRLNGVAQQPRVHPSRLICFHGLSVPALASVSWEDRFWGDSVIQSVDEAVQNAVTATAGFAALIDEAKIDVFKFSKLVEQLGQDGGDARVEKRVALTNTGKSIHRAIILDSEDEWETRQINWAGMPEVIRTYLAIVAGAADIPATRLLGKSPDGQNSTGESDLTNYFQMVGSKQEMDLRPAIEKLDAVVLPSAGVSTEDMSWSFSPLMVLSEKDQAEIENKEADTVTKYANAGMVPESAMAKAVQNRLIESQRWPGLQEAIEQAEAAGEGLPEDDPSEIVPVGGAAGQRIAANDAATWLADATPRPLYVQRKLINAADLIAWARESGFESTLPASDMHVTVLYSRNPVDPMKMGRDWYEDEKGQIVVRPGGPRTIERLGENAVVLRFTQPSLEYRHRDLVEAGGSHDWPDYQPHVTISYTAPEGADLDAVKPFNGKLVFGPETFEPLDLDWKSKISETR